MKNKLPIPESLLKEIQEKKVVDFESIIKINAVLLDALYRLSLQELDEDEFAFLESRLRKTPGHIEEYLVIMWKHVKNTQSKPEVEDA